MKNEEASLHVFDRMCRQWYFDVVQLDEDEDYIAVCHPPTSASRAMIAFGRATILHSQRVIIQ
jgi:hypothetical protein